MAGGSLLRLVHMAGSLLRRVHMVGSRLSLVRKEVNLQGGLARPGMRRSVRTSRQGETVILGRRTVGQCCKHSIQWSFQSPCVKLKDNLLFYIELIEQ